MRCVSYLYLLILLVFTPISQTDSVSEVRNGRPIIGVIAQELKPGKNNISFIAASYVKALEASGARVVPIFINKTEPYYRDVLGYINGVVIPGGSSIFDIPGGFASAVKMVYNIAKEINLVEKQPFPILGVCQGMEILSFIAANDRNPLVSCDSDNINLPLHFKPNYENSQLYRYLLPQFKQMLQNDPVTNNHHLFCLTEENFKNYGIDKEWTILSTNNDRKGLEFISSMESKQLPFAGVQFHPEKPAYEWNPNQHNPHNYPAIFVNRYFYDWIVNTGKNNNHRYPNKTMEKKKLIYNYPVTYTPEGYDLELYFFKNL